MEVGRGLGRGEGFYQAGEGGVKGGSGPTGSIVPLFLLTSNFWVTISLLFSLILALI